MNDDAKVSSEPNVSDAARSMNGGFTPDRGGGGKSPQYMDAALDICCEKLSSPKTYLFRPRLKFTSPISLFTDCENQRQGFFMRFTVPLLIAATFLSACGGPQLSSEQRAQRATNIANTDAALATARTVSVNGKTFRVAHVTQRNQALVELVGASTPYFVADVEAASRAATGCNGTFNAGILALVGGNIATANLADLRTKVSGRFDGWAVSLAC